MSKGAWDKVAYALLLVGGLNWGLIGFFDYNLVTELFGSSESMLRIIYGSVGVAAVYSLFSMSKTTGTSKKRK